MKTILDKIYEFSTPDWVDDCIKYIDKNGKNIEKFISKKFSDSTAKAFMINIKNKKVAIGRSQHDYHYDLVENDIDDCCSKMCIDTNEWTCRMEKGQDAKEFYEDNPHMRNIRCGRLWDLRDDKNLDLIVIGWWEELSTAKWYSYTMTVLKYYEKKFKKDNAKIDYDKTPIVGIDNNGDLFIVEIKAKRAVKKELDKRSESSEELYGVTKAIHLANQKDKDAYYREWKDRVNKHKDEELQKLGWRDKDRCYAKRNDKFAKHIVKDETTGKYKVVYGAKIGDSLELKSIEDIIKETNETNN